MLRLERTLARFEELIRERGGDPQRLDARSAWEAFLTFVEEPVGSGVELEPLGDDLIRVEITAFKNEVALGFDRNMWPVRDEDAFPEPLSVGAVLWFRRFGECPDAGVVLTRLDRLREALAERPEFAWLLERGEFLRGFIEVADDNAELARQET